MTTTESVLCEREHGLVPWELDRYEQEIALADRLRGSGAYHFERFRRSAVLLMGEGELLAATVRTLLQLGLRRPTVATAAELPDLAGDLEQSVAIVDDLGPWPDPARIAGFDAVLHCAERPMLGRAAQLCRAAQAAGVRALHTLPVDGAAWVGPSHGWLSGGCFECAWRRLRGTVTKQDPRWPALALVDRPDADPEECLPGPLTNMLATTAGLAYFRLAIGAEDPTGPRLTRIDLATGRAGEHRFHRHPACEAHRPGQPAPVAVRVAWLAASPPTTAEELSRRSTELIDPLLGVITALGEPDPENAATVTLADLTDSGVGPATITVSAPDRVRARRRAVVQALELAAGRLADSAPPGAPMWDPVAKVAAEPPAGDQHRAVAAGFSWPEAVGRAIVTALARVGEPVAGWEASPDLGDPTWAGRLDPLLHRLAGSGTRVLVTPVDSCPAIATALPFVAAVAIYRALGQVRIDHG